MKALTLAALAIGISASPASAGEDAGFSKLTIDLGVVVSDVEASLKFYTEVVGFEEAGEFTVSAEIAKAAGLADAKAPITIRKLRLGEGDGATTIKLMQFGQPKVPDQTYINSTTGFSYITIFVKNTKAALERAAKHGVKPLAEGPADLGEGKRFLSVIKDPDGNFVEFVGP